MKGALSALLLLAAAVGAAHAAPIYPPYPYGYACTSYGNPWKGDTPCSPGGSPLTVPGLDFLTDLTAKYMYGPDNLYGWWFDWGCKGGRPGWSHNLLTKKWEYGPVERNELYREFCATPNPTPVGWSKEINCKTDLSCPSESGCIGRQCFGTMWLSSVGYDGMMRSYADCLNDPIHCPSPWSTYLQTPGSFNGPWMDPKTKSPEPPFTKNTVWPN